MNTLKEFLKWLALPIGWAILWSLCLGLGELFNISPVLVLLIVTFGSFFILFVFARLYLFVLSKVYEKHMKRMLYIKFKYRHAYSKFTYKNNIREYSFIGIESLRELKKITSRDDSVWELEEKQLEKECERRNSELKKEFLRLREIADSLKKEYPQGYAKWEEAQEKSFWGISFRRIVDSKEEIAALDKHIKDEKNKEVKRRETCLMKAVSSWGVLRGGLRYSYLFYYYPTTCDFEATQEEWANRWMVWNFKNTPGKTEFSCHQEVLDKIIPMLKETLLKTFGAESIKLLTLVCIPASSQIKNQARYEEFSNRICSELGMTNAYSYITIVSEKEERRLGGASIDTSKLLFDEAFFKGKYVLLFDDVITRGDSMRTFKCKMETLGATVVGGLALGKTKHERTIDTNANQSQYELDELPF